MMWHATFLVIHIAAFVGFVYLFPTAPCWMQKLVVGMFAVAELTFAFAYGAAMLGVWQYGMVLLVASAVEHIGVLMYVFRLIYQGHLRWTPSAQSLSSQR